MIQQVVVEELLGFLISLLADVFCNARWNDFFTLQPEYVDLGINTLKEIVLMILECGTN